MRPCRLSLLGSTHILTIRLVSFDGANVQCDIHRYPRQCPPSYTCNQSWHGNGSNVTRFLCVTAVSCRFTSAEVGTLLKRACAHLLLSPLNSVAGQAQVLQVSRLIRALGLSQARVAEPPPLPEPVAIIASPFEAFAAQQPGEPWPVPGSPSDSSAHDSVAASSAHDSAVTLGAAFRAAELTEASLYRPATTGRGPDLAAPEAPNQAAAPNQASELSEPSASNEGAAADGSSVQTAGRKAIECGSSVVAGGAALQHGGEKVGNLSLICAVKGRSPDLHNPRPAF